MVDERTMRIDDLALEAKAKFRYVYDFGDNWVHELTVVSVKGSDPSAMPVCLDGKLAGPPEDCGGPPGYEELTEAVEKPDMTRTPEEKDLVEWAGPWTPDRLDLEMINRELKKL